MINPLKGFGIGRKFAYMVDGPPIIIYVYDDKWEAGSIRNPPTKRDLALFEVIKDMGGISNTVRQGTYHFNLERKRLRLRLTLLPVEPDVPS